MPAVQAREEAIRQARRLGDPAAVCAALAVTSAWEADEGRGRELAGRFVEAGLLTGEQTRHLLGVEPTYTRAASPAPADPEHLALEPAPVSVAVLEALEPVSMGDPAASPIPTPAVLVVPTETAPQTAEIGAAEAPVHGAVEPAPEAVEKPSRRPLLAAAFLGVAVALTFWASLGTPRPQAPAPPRTPEPQPAPFPSPLAPPPRPPQPPMWAPRLRQVCEGDSSAVHDRLRAIQRQIAADADAEGASFEARCLLARPPRKDRILRWVELTLGRFHAVADLRMEGVDVAWARE